MKKYTVIAESKKQNIYIDSTESFTIEAVNAREAVRQGRRICAREKLKFIRVKLVR
jgi:hypothetical protein